MATAMAVAAARVVATAMHGLWAAFTVSGLLRRSKEACSIYDPASDQCFPALERGPCDQGDWLIPDPGDPGLGRCQRMTVPTRGCEAIILESGEVGCSEDLEDENDVAFFKVTLTSYWPIL